MNQITKFYLTSFLKNQTYFTPILILLLQFYRLSYSEVFWVFTIGSIFSFIIEIPTGVLADLWGKRRSIILSKFGIFISYIAFGFSNSFWMFVVSQILYELGNAFRSGTETAYTYDYIVQHKGQKGLPSYTEVKGKQKFYARVGESIAAAIGGFIAVRTGYSFVFFIAAIPAFFNFILALRWEKIKENDGDKITLVSSLAHTVDSFKDLLATKGLWKITINIAIFTSVLAALNKFIQPYMLDANVPVEWFGIIYTISLVFTALAVRYSYLFEKKFGTRSTINFLSLFAVIPAVIIGLKFVSIVGVILFFIVVIIDNIRSPIANDEFHSYVKSSKRATLGSMLEQAKAIGKIMILPFAGYFADVFSIYTSVLILAFLLLFNGALFFVAKHKAYST